MHLNPTTEVQALERAIDESIRAVFLQLDDLRTAIERLRQLRHAADERPVKTCGSWPEVAR
jgi:hypothetical protein